MDILIEIQKEEMEVQNLVKDWHVQKLASFIEDLIEKDRIEQLRLHDVSGQLPNNLILYRQAKRLDYAEFCKWINAKLGNLR